MRRGSDRVLLPVEDLCVVWWSPAKEIGRFAGCPLHVDAKVSRSDPSEREEGDNRKVGFDPVDQTNPIPARPEAALRKEGETPG